MHRCEHAADPVWYGFIGHRTVRNGEVSLLKAVVADVLELEVVHPGGGSAIERRIDKRADDVQDLREAFARRLSHGRRMLVPEHRPIRIVIELAIAGTPPQQERKSVGQKKPDHHPKGRRPGLNGSN